MMCPIWVSRHDRVTGWCLGCTCLSCCQLCRKPQNMPIGLL